MNSFNDKFINNWKQLQSAKIGFELEFYSNFSYIKTLELLNLEFQPIEVWGFNQYHSDFVVTDKLFKIEPDYSGGSEMIELITGPMQWIDARVILIKALNFIKKYGYTDDHCSIHINISFTDLDIKELNPVKLILNLDEDYIYNYFPNRRNNIYARSIKWLVPFEDFNNTDTAINNVIQTVTLPDDTKYYGVNLQKKWKGWLEFRYIGGADYQNKIDEIISLSDYFILQSKNAITQPLNEEDNIKLYSYLEDNINWFKQYKTYNSFLSNIEGIKLQVDMVDSYEIINANWDKIKNPLFALIKACTNIKNAVINYNSTSNKLEVVNAIINNISYINNFDFIDCTITECTIFNCDIVNCIINNGHIYNSNIYESKVSNCKLSKCDALEYSILDNCLFDEGLLDCVMKNGVFRSGQIGENADIDITVKMASIETFWKVGPNNNKKIDKLK